MGSQAVLKVGIEQHLKLVHKPSQDVDPPTVPDTYLHFGFSSPPLLDTKLGLGIALISGPALGFLVDRQTDIELGSTKSLSSDLS